MSRRRRSRALHQKALARDKRESLVPSTAPEALDRISHVELVGSASAPESGMLEVREAPSEDALELANAAASEELTMTPPPVSTSSEVVAASELPPSSFSATTMAAHVEEDPMPSVPPARLDEGSLPPLTSNIESEAAEAKSETDVDDEPFFSQRLIEDPDEAEVEDPAVRLAREAAERRAAVRRTNSRKYVAAVVGLCALMGALGFSQRLMTGKAKGTTTSVAAAAKQPAGGEQTQVLAPLPAIQLAQAPAPVAEPAQAPAAAAPQAPAAPKAEDITHPDDVVVAPKEEPKVDAKAEKRAAQRSLESGKVALAIEHATASVQADETDAEAWLLLGASYQEKGQIAKARESFSSCMKLAKHGPKGECAAMLR
ncbi:MAG: hypothetical protein U0174_19430 [Polyangiaceae bacterium]